MSKIINTAADEAKKTATAQPNSFIYIDRILQMKTDGYNVQVTVGWEAPNGKYNPVATIVYSPWTYSHMGRIMSSEWWLTTSSSKRSLRFGRSLIAMCASMNSKSR
jgi:hypothetical protein